MSGLRLGNLTIKDVELKHKFNVSHEDRIKLEETRQDSAQVIEEGKYHIFDLPQTSFHFRSRKDAENIVSILGKYNADIKGQIHFTIDGD